MAEFATPQHPSVYMTPSSSTGKAIYCKPKGLTPLPLSPSFLSPVSTPSKAEEGSEEFKDILVESFKKGLPHVSDKILSMLTASDLCNCLQVSQTWKELISNDCITNSMHRIAEHRKKLKENAENHVKGVKRSVTSMNRTALGTLADNTWNNPKRHRSTSVLPPKEIKHRPCPCCQSPARELNSRRAECTNAYCGLDFCKRCFYSWHEGPCPQSSSPKRSSSIQKVGTKASKERLRRLKKF